jgi:hypothetical protein
VLARSRLITTRNESCEGGSTSGLCNYPQSLPKSQLRTPDRVVGNQDYVVYVLFGDGVDEGADATRCQRIRCDPASRGVDWFSCIERHRQRWEGFGLDADHFDLSAKLSRDPGDKPATSDRYEERVEIGTLLLHLQPDCPLAQQRLTLVKGVDRERS